MESCDIAMMWWWNGEERMTEKQVGHTDTYTIGRWALISVCRFEETSQRLSRPSSETGLNML